MEQKRLNESDKVYYENMVLERIAELIENEMSGIERNKDIGKEVKEIKLRILDREWKKVLAIVYDDDNWWKSEKKSIEEEVWEEYSIEVYRIV